MRREVTREFPRFEGWTILVEPLHEASVLAVRPILWVTSSAVILVLLIALVNLATLFRIRTIGRTDELGVRSALGAGWTRVARLLAVEAVGLSAVGATLGIALARPLVAGIRGMVPLWINIPDSAARVPVLRADLDPWVAGLCAGLAVLGAAFLVAPQALSTARRRSAAWGGRPLAPSSGTRWLVALELALATVFCLGAGLTARSAHALLAIDVGLQDEGLLTMYFGDVWHLPVTEQVAYFEDVVRQVESLPGVTSAALIDYIPFQGEDDYARVYFLDRSFQPLSDVREEWRRVSARLFETAGMTLFAGRFLTSEDAEGTPRVAIVNASFARKHYPRGDAVGSYVSTHDEAYRDMRIVGVVADVRSNGPATPAPPILYVPLQGNPRGTTGLYVRAGTGDAASVAEAVRDAIWTVDPSQPVVDILPMTDLVESWVAIPRAVRSLVGGIATFSLVLAGLGVFGVVAHTIRGRTAEFGIRLALGASPAGLGAGVLRRTLPLVILGVVSGLVAGVASAEAARAVLFGVAPVDPPSMAGAVAGMIAAAVLAIYLPARRVARIDPADAMRSK
jgi:putative ABC transport system permease protein